MCGIVGYVGNKQVVPLIVDGLRKLEYRGYDSAGIAVIDDNRELSLRRAEGKLRNLEECIRLNPLDGNYGIGHTRWATHGRPTEENAHPHRHQSGKVVVVHNGIIENYIALKERLEGEGHEFVTETDSEDPWVSNPPVRRSLVLVVDPAQGMVIDQLDMTPRGGL